jgi:hypothetical protein
MPCLAVLLFSSRQGETLRDLPRILIPIVMAVTKRKRREAFAAYRSAAGHGKRAADPADS